jgi:hypothetical protein
MVAMLPDWDATAVSPPADVTPMGAPESATSDVTRPLPDVAWNCRTATDAGAVHPVVFEDLLAHRETTHADGLVVTTGVVCAALLRASAVDAATATGCTACVPE